MGVRRLEMALVVSLVVLVGCTDPAGQQPADPSSQAAAIDSQVTSSESAGALTSTPGNTDASDPEEPITTIAYTVDAAYPHDSQAWTQGLAYAGPDRLFEGTGDYENSSLREVVLRSGEVLRAVSLPSPLLYGEGITTFDDLIIQLTWKAGTGFVYRADDFSLVGQFEYPAPGAQQPHEGWGITTDGTRLFLSDGTSNVYVADARRVLESGVFEVEQVLEVSLDGRPVGQLNELEYIDGQIYANVWLTDRILRIDPTTGMVNGVLDLQGLLTEEEQGEADVLNGIAFDPTTGQLLVTGKYWPHLFALTLG